MQTNRHPDTLPPTPTHYQPHVARNIRRRRRPWAALMSVIILLIVLVYIVFEVLYFLHYRGTQ